MAESQKVRRARTTILGMGEIEGVVTAEKGGYAYIRPDGRDNEYHVPIGSLTFLNEEEGDEPSFTQPPNGRPPWPDREDFKPESGHILTSKQQGFPKPW